MDLDLFDALLLDADIAFLETAFSSAETISQNDPLSESAAAAATAQALAQLPQPVHAAVQQRSPAPPPQPPQQQRRRRLAPSAHRSDSCTQELDACALAVAAEEEEEGESPSHVRGESKAGRYLPPCRVCNGQASGFHYGVNTCEACKGFFHRSLRRHSPYKCSMSGKCSISHLSRSTCSACRYQRCLNVGMTKDAVKTGRYSYAKRTQDTLEVKRLQSKQGANWCGGASPAIVTDCQLVGDYELLGRMDCRMDTFSGSPVERIASAFEQSFGETLAFYKEPKKIETLIRDTLLRYNATNVDFVLFGDPEDRKHLLQMRDDFFNTLQSVSIDDASLCESSPSSGFRTDTDAQIDMLKYYMEKLELIIRSIVNFAKSIPGFTSLNMHDQIVLIKAGRPEVIYLLKYKHLDMKLSCTIEYNCDKNVVNLVPLSVMRRVWQDEEFHRQCWSNARRLQQLDLSVSDVSLLAAVALASPDREHLLEPERVHAIQETLVAALRHSIAAHRCHGDLPAADRFLASLLLQLPQLRTLNLQNELFAASVQRRCQFSLPPLVQECLSTQQPDGMQCSSAETAGWRLREDEASC